MTAQSPSRLHQLMCHHHDCNRQDTHQPEIHDAVIGVKEAIKRGQELAKIHAQYVYMDWEYPRPFRRLIGVGGDVTKYREGLAKHCKGELKRLSKPLMRDLIDQTGLCPSRKSGLNGVWGESPCSCK